ncbi:lipoprotein NlpD [Pandoraea thiooxydans]|nr:lipoprotein NlpD [Pandoraea thiooxydans]
MLLLPALLAACASAPSGGPVGDGYYRVRSGDTLGKIAQTYRQSVTNLTRWNNLSNPNRIDVGQVLRVAPPVGASGAVSTQTVAPAAASDNTSAPASSIALRWPAQGPVIARFNGTSNKGIDIGGQLGQPVVAAAAGKVVYAGNGLRGYGNLVMLKHSGGFLTAYAHNRVILVKEGQYVAQGQQIAEMGNTDSQRVQLHFELRQQGKPLDPLRYLPSR